MSEIGYQGEAGLWILGKQCSWWGGVALDVIESHSARHFAESWGKGLWDAGMAWAKALRSKQTGHVCD